MSREEERRESTRNERKQETEETKKKKTNKRPLKGTRPASYCSSRRKEKNGGGEKTKVGTSQKGQAHREVIEKKEAQVDGRHIQGMDA